MRTTRPATRSRRVKPAIDRAPALPAKLTRPDVDGVVPRPRVWRVLDRCSRRPITWLHAPAGAGKTTAIASWIAARRHRALWYVVDAGDAEPLGLFHDLRRAAAPLLRSAIALPVPGSDSPSALRAAASHFFDRFFAALPPGTVLVFDDAHAASDAPGWEEAFAALCDRVTDHVRIVVGSRVAPSAALARPCGTGALQVIDWATLRCDASEAGALAARADRSAGDGAELLAITDGWMAAMALLARSVPHVAPVQRPVAERAGSDTPRRPAHDLDVVFAWLSQAVLDELPPDDRTLLVRLSLLPTFTPGMAAALTERDDAGSAVARLHRARLLIERHGEAGYRIHALFRAVLLREAEVAWPADAWRTLMVRAGLILADDGQLRAAVEALGRAEAHDALAGIVERHAPRLLAEHRAALVAEAVSRLPPELRRERPWLSYWEAVVTLGRPDGRAAELAEEAFVAFRDRGDAAGALTAWSLVIEATIAAGEDFRRLGEWLVALEKLALEPPDAATAVRVAIAEVQAYGHWEAGTPRAVAATDRAVEIVTRHGSPADRLRVASAALLVHVLGNRQRAEDMRRLVRAERGVARLDPFHEVASLHAEAILDVTGADHRSGLRAIERGLVIARDHGLDLWVSPLLTVGLIAALGCREGDVAEQMLDTMALTVVGAPAMARCQYAYGRAWSAFERRESLSALRWLDGTAEASDRLAFRFGTCQDALARVVFAGDAGDRGRFEAAVAALDAHVAALDSPWLAASAALAAVFGRFRLGDDAVDDLRSAMVRAREVGLVIPAIHGRRVVEDLVVRALEHDVEVDLAATLARRFALPPPPAAVELASWPWPVQIRALGPLEIVVDDAPVQLGRKPPTVPLALLKILACSADPVPVERLAAALWPASDARARGALDTAIYRLRKLLRHEAAVVFDDGRVSLAPGLCWTDVRALTHTCDRIDELTRIERAASAADLERAEARLLALYRGPLGATDDPAPVGRAREQLRRRLARAVRDLRRAWAVRGDGDRAERLRDEARARDDGLALGEDP